MIKKILIPVIIILFLKSCGYTPIFTSKNLDINFNNIDYKKNALNKSFARSIKSLSNINSSNFYDVEINAESNRTTVAKDSKGNAEVYKLELSLEITLIGKSNESKIKETFMKSVNYKNSSDKFQLKQNENNLIDQMTQSILQDILKVCAKLNMIKKSYEINKSLNEDFFLLYGENTGLIEELINKNFKNQFKESTFTYNEKEIFRDIGYFYDNLLTNSFFESSKLIIIKEISDKSLEIVETLIEKKIKDLKIIFVGKILDKKSKIRKFFEKEKNLICIPCYQDNFKTLSNIIENFFKELKRSISADLRNLIIEKSQGDRKKLINDLNKIDLFLINKKQFKIEDIKKLISTSENQNLSELADYCLAKNLKKTTSLLNDYLISNEENILLIKIFISKIKRLKRLKKETSSQKNLDILISDYKPPIFWKDKDLVKQQINSWTYEEINELLKTINNLELKTKKNYGISNLLTNNFIMEKAKLTNS